MGKLSRQILKGMIVSQGWFFSDLYEYVMYCGIIWRQTFQERFESSYSTTQTQAVLDTVRRASWGKKSKTAYLHLSFALFRFLVTS